MADSIKVRIAVGLTLIAAFTGLLWFDHVRGGGWGALVLAVALVCSGLWEYSRMARAGIGPHSTAALVGAGALYMALEGLGYLVDPRLHQLRAPLVVLVAYGVFFGALRGAPSPERLRGMAAAAFGFFYIAWLGAFALDVRFLPRVGEAGFFYVIAVAKGTDICAYFAGKLLGRTKLVPSVSPGKTVAGFVGALTGGVLITGLFSQLSALGELVPLPLVPGVGIVMALVVVSGDLIESFVKRSAAVKDSANLLPNFGGVLDVIDSVVIAAPVVYFVLVGLAALRGALT